MSYIEINQVTKTFSDVKRGTELTTLDRVLLTAESNDFLCILGPSGCGKSTLMNLIAGFEKVSTGQILVNGMPVKGPGSDRGVVFQQPTLMPWLNVWENVSFHLKIRRVSAKKRREQAQTYIDLVGLKGFENHYPYQLSGGMNQRVGIARALMLQPAVILMDEPFAALDAQTKMDMQEELVSIWEKQKVTIIFITHSPEEALILGNKIAIMTHRPGRIKELISVDLPRPRDTTTAEFNDFKRRIIGSIKEEGALLKAASDIVVLQEGKDEENRNDHSVVEYSR